MSELTKISVRLRPGEIAALDKLAKARALSRSDVMRAVVATGLPLVAQGFKFNLERILFILEHVGASVDVIMAREHGDVYEHLVALASERMDQFHA